MAENLGIACNGALPTPAGGELIEADRFDNHLGPLPNIPPACPDQNLDSLVALAGIYNGLGIGREAIGRVLGSQIIKTDRTFHAGFLQAYKVLRGLGYNSYENFMDNHSFLPFFKAFAPATTYARASAKLESNQVTGLNHLLATGNTTVPRRSYRYCVQCAIRSIEKRGYAYAQLTHQFQVVEFCPEHATVLFTTASEDTLTDAIGYGLIFPSDQFDWQNLLTPVTPLSESPAWRALGQWARFTMTDVFSSLSAESRTTLLQRRMNEMPREKGDPSSPANRLERHLVRVYGLQVFENIGLPIFAGVTGHWPAFLILGTAYTDHLLANLLVLSALFHSPAQFSEYAVNLQCASALVARKRSKPGARPRRVAWSLSFIRDCYREPTILAIARKRGHDHTTSESMLRLHPELPKRREIFLAKIELKKKRRVLEAFMSANPGATRTIVAEHNRSEFDWLMDHDREWITSHIPTKRDKRPRQTVSEDYALLDARVIRKLLDIVKHHIDERNVERVTRPFLTRALDPHERTLLASKKLPKAAIQIDALIESKDAHLSRIESNLKSLIASRSTSMVRQNAKAIIITYRDHPEYLNKILDLIISDHMAPDSLKAAA